MNIKDLGFSLGILTIAALLIKIIYYFKAKLEGGTLISFLKAYFRFLGLWVILPVKINPNDSKEIMRHKSISNVALIVFYFAFTTTLIISYLTVSESTDNYKHFKKEYENQQKRR